MESWGGVESAGPAASIPSVPSGMLEQESHTFGFREQASPCSEIRSPQQMQMQGFMARRGASWLILPTSANRNPRILRPIVNREITMHNQSLLEARDPERLCTPKTTQARIRILGRGAQARRRSWVDIMDCRSKLES